RRGETIGARRQISSSQQAAEALTPIVGTAEPGEPEYLYLRDPAGATILCSRGPGTVTAAALDLEAHGWTSGWPKAIAPVVLVVFALVLFLILAFRGRVDLWNALLLAGLFFVTAIF